MSDKPSPKRDKSRRASVESTILKAIALKCFPDFAPVSQKPAKAEQRAQEAPPDTRENEEIMKAIKAGWTDCDLRQRFDESVKAFLIK